VVVDQIEDVITVSVVLVGNTMAVAFIWIDDVMAGVDASVVSRVVVVATLV
jgi:hypothetical protein